MLRTPLPITTTLCLLILLAAPIRTSAATITLDSNGTFQTMSGWEVTPWVSSICDPAYSAIRDTVVALAIDDVGIDRIRLEVRSGSENTSDFYQQFIDDGCPNPPDPLYDNWRHNRYATIDDNGDPDVIDWSGFHFTALDETIDTVVIPMRDRLASRGESLYINLCYVAFTTQIKGGSYHHDDPEEYAEFVLATYLHMNQIYGFVPDAWEVLLEPDNVPQWNGTTIGQAIVASASKLQSNGFTPNFIAPSNTSMFNVLGYFDDLLAVPGAIDHLRMFSYHRYGQDDAILEQIAERAVLYGLETGMLEWWFGNANYDVLLKDLGAGRNSSFQGRTLRSLFDVDAADPDDLIVSYQKDTQYNRQYFKFIRSGAVRIAAASDVGSVSPLAWINPDGTWVTVLKCDSGEALNVEGLPAGTYGLKYTTGVASQWPIEYDVDLPDVVINSAEPLATSIPTAGLLTIYGRPGEPTAAPERFDASESRHSLVAFPNPAGLSITLRLSLDSPGEVQILLLDSSGRQVSNRQLGNLDAGARDVELTTGGLPSGVYFGRAHLDQRTLGSFRVVVP